MTQQNSFNEHLRKFENDKTMHHIVANPLLVWCSENSKKMCSIHTTIVVHHCIAASCVAFAMVFSGLDLRRCVQTYTVCLLFYPVTSKPCTDGDDGRLTRCSTRAHKHKFMNVPTQERSRRTKEAIL